MRLRCPTSSLLDDRHQGQPEVPGPQAAYLDYLAFRIFDGEERVIGERRFLGLFSSSAYSESVSTEYRCFGRRLPQ